MFLGACVCSYAANARCTFWFVFWFVSVSLILAWLLRLFGQYFTLVHWATKNGSGAASISIFLCSFCNFSSRSLLHELEFWFEVVSFVKLSGWHAFRFQNSGALRSSASMQVVSFIHDSICLFLSPVPNVAAPLSQSLVGIHGLEDYSLFSLQILHVWTMCPLYIFFHALCFGFPLSTCANNCVLAPLQALGFVVGYAQNNSTGLCRVGSANATSIQFSFIEQACENEGLISFNDQSM